MRIDFTTALGRLLCDSELRGRFRRDRQSAVADLDLSPSDRTALLSLGAAELDHQAEGLIRKRFAEVAAILPRTVASMGSAAVAMFGEYANKHWPTGHHRHIEDAAGFAQFLAKRTAPHLCNAELNAITFAVGKSRAALRMSRVIVGRRRRLALQFLFRQRGMPHQFFVYLGAKN